jgi:hypothetical protein
MSLFFIKFPKKKNLLSLSGSLYATLKKNDQNKNSGIKKSFLLDFGYVESVGSVLL